MSTIKKCSNCRHWGVSYESVCDVIDCSGKPPHLVVLADDDSGLQGKLKTPPDFSCSLWQPRPNVDPIDERITAVLDDPKTQDIYELVGADFLNGGCLTFAVALVTAFGPGRIICAHTDADEALHYGAILGDKIYDAQGAYATEDDWLTAVTKSMQLPDGYLTATANYTPCDTVELDVAVAMEVAALLADTSWKATN